MFFDESPHPQLNKNNVIHVMGIKKSFLQHIVCKEINLEIKRNKTLSILGPSGCGKTVLIKMLIGLIQPDEGHIFFNDVDVASFEREEQYLPVRKKIAMVFQGAALFDSLNVFENIAYPLRVQGLKDEKKIERRILNTLELVDLSKSIKKMPSELSGGMRKRIGLARAIVTNPEVILYDEPTAGLDPINTHRISDLILSLQKELKCTSVVVTHDMHTVESVSNEVAFIYNGRVRQVGTFKELQMSEDAIVRGFITGDPNLLLTSFGNSQS